MEIDYSNTWDKKCPQIKCRKDQCTGLTYVFIPATLGDDRKGSKVAPKNGAYCNAIVLYEADHAVYIYSKEGIPTKATSGYTFYNDILDRPFYNGEMMTSSTSIPKVPDAVSELTNDLNYQTKNDVDAAILVETTARELADQTLQGEIDTIVASSDVKDIVGTYAELEAYDTSTLGNNDIIKVLQDETHNDAETYYRWSTSTETFTYIGELGPFYTKSETDTLLGGKQDTLTAGTNITIAADNTISSKAQTIFYMNSSESGSTRHIYKKSDMTDPATSQEVFDANDLGQVILRISTSVDPASYSDAYLQNAYKASGDYQLLFLDEKTYRSFDVTDLSSSTFTYSSRVIQDQIVAGEGIAITNNVVSADFKDSGTRYSYYVDGTSGSDNSAGTSASPFKTLAKALSKCNSVGSSFTIQFKTAGTYNWGSSLNIVGKNIIFNVASGVTGVIITLPGNVIASACTFNFQGGSAGGIKVISGTSGTLRHFYFYNSTLESRYTDYNEVRINPYGSTVHVTDCEIYALYARGGNVRLASVTVLGTYDAGNMITGSEGSDLELGTITAAARSTASSYALVRVEAGSHLSVNGALTDNTTPGASYTYGISSNAAIIQEISSYVSQYEAVGGGIQISNSTLHIKNNAVVAGNEDFTFTMVDDTTVVKNLTLGA